MGGSSEYHLRSIRERFEAIYEQNAWGRGSGVGSLPENNLEYATFLQLFLLRNSVRSVVDFGCGDWQFSRFINWTKVKYIGIDIVPILIERNQNIFGQEQISFEVFHSIDALPSADLLVCKDVLQHLPNSVVQQYLDVFKSKFKFMLITNDIGPTGYLNREIEPGGWRTLQFDRPPFAETAAVVLQWTVHDGGGWTSKATYLFYGNGPHQDG